jgi:type IV pilus assembly protein PilW
MPVFSFHGGQRQRGMSLVEIMVGLLVGLLGILVITQVYIFYEGRKRTTASGADAQNNGAIALYTLERDIQQAGYGLTSMDLLRCQMNIGAMPNHAAAFANGKPFVPFLVIPDGLAAGNANNLLGIPPGDAGSDIVVVMSGNGGNIVEGVPISAHNASSVTLPPTGFALNDFVMLGQAGQNCSIAEITGPNPVTSPLSVSPNLTVAYTPNDAKLFDLGYRNVVGSSTDFRGLAINVYAVRQGTLTMCDFWTSDCTTGLPGAPGGNATWVPVASNIVGLRAQYGWDTTSPPDMIPDAYCRSRLNNTTANCPANDDASPASSVTPPGTACELTRALSVRLALVARSNNPETTDVSNATIPLWPDMAAPVAQAATFTVPSQRYRYKVFQTIIPLRNTLWLGPQSSC